MGFFDFIGDLASGIEEVGKTNFTINVGDETFQDVFTTIGKVAGGVWEIVGEIADEATKDNVLDLNEWIK
jgi:hypothetical protein